ncbi:D-amino-acid dehydrogenase [Pseudacidovorax sp. 1753]|uniref:NAD(P)/FAD-dependent oxidoreductase n=1 Tax=Pseudacidovorax sp. 1753 TaxID=3156419 RepID=UPI0033951164
MKKTVVVLGAGMVGVSCALELQQRGRDVVLVDRAAPGRETSFGNAGVFARSSLMPMNNPALWAALPKLARNTSAQLRYDPRFLLRNAGWAARFLYSARTGCFEQTVEALDRLITLSRPLHDRWMAEAGVQARLRSNGWIFLYRSEAAYASGMLSRQTMDRFGIQTQTLSGEELRALEPHLAPIFPKALWIQDAASVDNPGAVVEAYAALFQARGGRIVRDEVKAIHRSQDAWEATGTAGRLRADDLVVALGPWSRTFLRDTLGLSVPMAYERGYHRHFGARPDATLGRPVYDIGGGYVLSPMEMGLRMSTGVELADIDAPKADAQLQLAETAAREAFPLADYRDSEPWLGRRPTLPDSRPAIGRARSHPSLWFAFGHQHIGLSTGPGSAQLLANLMDGAESPIDPRPFAPARWGL